MAAKWHSFEIQVEMAMEEMLFCWSIRSMCLGVVFNESRKMKRINSAINLMGYALNSPAISGNEAYSNNADCQSPTHTVHLPNRAAAKFGITSMLFRCEADSNAYIHTRTHTHTHTSLKSIQFICLNPCSFALCANECARARNVQIVWRWCASIVNVGWRLSMVAT